MASQISHLNNNLTTNYTDNDIEQLTIKTSSLENLSVNLSPLNFKFLMMNLNNICNKITPMNQNKFNSNFKLDNFKSLENDI